MKKIFKNLALVAAAAMGFTACQKEIQNEIPVNDSTVQVTFVAGSADTKTSVDTSGEKPVFAWGENETFAVLEQTDALAEATSVSYANADGKANITAEFAANPGKESYDYVTIYPAGGYVSATGLANATLSLPAVQTMTEASYDPAADLMVSEVVSLNAQPAEAQMVRFTRLAAVVKMSLKGLGLEANDQVEQVIFTAEGKSLAGTVTADLADPHGFTVAEGLDNVTVNTTSSDEVYFTVLPAALEAGDAYTITVLTNKKIYIKESTIPSDKVLTFEAGMVTRFGVNMAEVEPIDKWILVRDASSLKEGDVVTIVAKDYDMAISKKLYSNASETSTSARRDAVAISKYQDYLIVNENVQLFTLVPGSATGTFSFYDEARAKFLVSNNKTSRYLINQAYVDSNTSFAFTIDAKSGDATVKNIEGDYTDNMIRYYNSSKYFYSGTSANQAICVYRLEGTVGTLPVVAANVTVPDVDESVVIAEEGAVEPAAISDVVFNYVGNWTISASAEAEWIKVAYDADKNCLTYTADANVGAKRETTVTINANLEGQEELSWTFNVTQKGAPQEISIEEFAKKGKDENTVYKLTGKVVEIPSSTSGKWKLGDENDNTAQIQYFKTEEGAYVKGNVDVKVGDVITVTTVVAGSTVGLGGNSTYPSIYKGHYTLTATASGSVGYEGGDVTVNVKVQKFGHAVVPSPIFITSSEVVEDDNLVSVYNFTDNGDGTATALVSLFENTTGGSRKLELTYSAGSPLAVTANVTIMQDVNPSLKKGWWLVTDVNDLQAGDKIIIAATGLDYAISTETYTNNRKSKPITKNGASLKDVADNIQQYALEVDANGLYSFKGTLGSDADKYIYAASSSSNHMKVSTTLDDNGKFTVAIASDGAAIIIAQGTNTRNHMQYNNKSTSSPAFYCTDGSFGAVCLYKLYE